MNLARICIVSCLAVGCATASTAPVITGEQEAGFHALVEKARKAGATGRYTAAGAKLADAESDFYYAQHLPREPERARRMAAQARAEAEAALALAQLNAGPGNQASSPATAPSTPTPGQAGSVQGTLAATPPAPTQGQEGQGGSVQETLAATAP